MTELTFFPTDWRSEDVEPDKGEPYFRINIFGKTMDGKTVCVRAKFTPFFLLETPESWSAARTNLFITETAMKYDAIRPSCLPTKRKNMWGYDGGKMRPMVQFVFKTLSQMRKAKYRLKNEYQIYESSVDPIIRIFHLRNINPADWMHVSKAFPVETRISNSDIEVETSFQHLGPSDLKEVPPLIIASWDIETYSKDRKFPLAENPADYCIQIATTFQKYGEPEPYRRVVVCYKQTASVEGVEIISCAEEADVMNTWMTILQDEITDVSIGYNLWQYDLRYIHGRSMMCVDDITGEDNVRLKNLGRLLVGGGEVIERDLSSNAFGQNKFFLLDMPGVMQIDLLQWFRKNRNLESYSLNNVSKLYLGDQKNDLPAMQIFEKFEGGADDRAIIAAYARKDTDLPLKLLKKMAILEDITEMANAVKVPVDYINFRGQQVRAFSCLVGKARQMNYAIPDDKMWTVDGKYEGATVLDAKKGAYFTSIAALDFASLYPSIIRAHNMSPETLVMDKRFENLPGIEYYEIETGLGTFKYPQKNDETGEGQGVVPALLDDLAKFRKQAKKHMAEAKKNDDEFREALYDAQQRSYKIVMNSVYGFLGASRGFIPCVPIAASVTATGRKMIEHTAKRVTELLPGSEVIYGDTDSVMIRMKLPDDKIHDMDEQFKMAKWLAGEITKDFKAPNDLEFEKIYYPYILYSKKRYAAIKFEDPDEKGKVDVKGLALVRRDFSPITREILKESLDTILFKKDTPTAVTETVECIRKVLDNEYPMEKFTMSKTLKTGYKNECQPHLHVSNKIFERTGFPVPSGARVPFVYIEDKKNLDTKQSFRAEDPTFAQENDLIVDRLFYIEHQLMKPICSLFEPLLDDPETEIFGHPLIKGKIDELKSTFKADLRDAKRTKKNIANNQREITSFFKKK
uniref:DNA polymerase n=2 Tax=Paramecium bursaria Chlorella virus NY2A TaxID=46021 RepID=DPOL_PBCVN|nr:RecName: Full=DNA polymerase [Paramecium bursaria Chlorella virus NY2A]pir/B42543/ DNA-directed DNA polymerase (EC 2.7.7.7) - Chlorella virus CV-NY-2A [Paramecium bursaria Chlorella virus NY2A]AAA88827.1 DNA polymerase [Paramecium bursaria Chlorella virus NY2A]